MRSILYSFGFVAWVTLSSVLPLALLFGSPRGGSAAWLALGLANAGLLAWKALRDHRRARELDAARRRAEIASLEALIKPHFLFNALNGITALIHEDPQRAEETALRLARLMRHLLEARSGEMRSLESELGVTSAYLEIERVRMGARLAYEFDVPAALASTFIPSLVLQPLLENAVRHGVWQREGGGLVRLRASRDGDHCRIEITDNGPGLKAGRASGHSLEWVQERLSRLYGDRYELRLERDEQAGETIATLRLPLVRSVPEVAAA